MVPITSFYLPFAFVVVQMLFKQSPFPGIYGIAVAHLYYFLKELYPAASGRDLLKTPQWFKKFAFNRLGVGANPQPSAVPHSGFRAFASGGRRLGTS
jgi:Derlin-2/3